MTALRADRPFGTTRGGFALLLAVTTIAGSLIPAGGLLAAFGSLLSGVRDDRRRVRALLIVAVCSFALQVAFVAFAVWGPDPGLRLVPRRSGDLPDLVDGLTR